MALIWDNPTTGAVKAWTYEWRDITAWIDSGEGFQITGSLLPTPTTCRTTAVDTFTWHHLAPMVGFRITRSGSTITITSIPEPYYTQDFPYSSYNPTIAFYYMDASGNYVAIGSFGSAASYNGTSISATAQGLSQTGIYADCTAIDCTLHGKKNFLGYVKLHTHIDPPAAPTITATTGKTITVSNGEDGLYCNTTNDGWYSTPHTFTGLTQGTNYSFKCRKYCPDCSEGNVYESTNVTGKTWNISGRHLSSGAKSMVFKATHVAGTGGNASARTITYKLYETKSTSGTVIATKTGNNGIPVTFTDLEPGKTYYCYAYTTGLGSGDNNCWIEGASTKSETTISDSSGDVSATTLRASVSWSSGGATSVVCTIECNGQTRTLSSSGSYVGFIGLIPGTIYIAHWRIVSTYTYSYTYTIINENGEEEVKTGTGADVIETEGGIIRTTKKAEFVPLISTSSKIIKFRSKSNDPSDIMEQRISSSSTWDTIEQITYGIYNNLTHNTQYTIYCRIAGCYAFNTSGNVTSVNDSEISQTVSTKLLSLSASISEEHQHSLVTLWQAYVDGVATDADAIDGTAFEFTYMDTIAKKSNPPYQASEVIEGSNGNTTGDYQSDKKIYSNDLTWYYCEYIVTASITDGYNIVAAAVAAHTIFPAIWIHSGGQWHRYMPHVYTNGKYVPAPGFVYKNNKYAEPNGE